MQNNGGWLVVASGGGSTTSPAPHFLIGLSSPGIRAGIMVTAGHRQPGHQSQVGVVSMGPYIISSPCNTLSHPSVKNTSFIFLGPVLLRLCCTRGPSCGSRRTTGAGTTIHNGSMTFLLSVAALQTANMTMTDRLVCQLQNHI